MTTMKEWISWTRRPPALLRESGPPAEDTRRRKSRKSESGGSHFALFPSAQFPARPQMKYGDLACEVGPTAHFRPSRCRRRIVTSQLPYLQWVPPISGTPPPLCQRRPLPRTGLDEIDRPCGVTSSNGQEASQSAGISARAIQTVGVNNPTMPWKIDTYRSSVCVAVRRLRRNALKSAQFEERVDSAIAPPSGIVLAELPNRHRL